jgi:hypothetical protein
VACGKRRRNAKKIPTDTIFFISFFCIFIYTDQRNKESFVSRLPIYLNIKNTKPIVKFTYRWG